MDVRRGRIRKHAGFTLVELVVVVMILGILAAVAAPRVMGTSKQATENSIKHTLAVVRTAIERYAADNNGEYPTDIETSLAPYLRGDFPICPLNNSRTVDEATTISAATADGGWAYNTTTGDFVLNSNKALEDGRTYAEL